MATRESNAVPVPVATSFTTLWRQCEPAVVGFCRRAVHDPADADELAQRVMIRAWRGHRSFRGDALFATWVMQIAAREAARMHGQLARRRRRELPLDGHEVADGAEHAVDDDVSRATQVAGLVADAAAAGLLNDLERAVVELRLRHPDAPWSELGAALGRPPVAAAVAHCRAGPKLRVFLFTDRPDLLGGHDAIGTAFRRALADPRTRMTAAEAEAFRTVVLEGRDYRRRGWQTHLRAACTAVVAHLGDTPLR